MNKRNPAEAAAELAEELDGFSIDDAEELVELIVLHPPKKARVLSKGDFSPEEIAKLEEQYKCKVKPKK